MINKLKSVYFYHPSAHIAHIRYAMLFATYKNEFGCPSIPLSTYKKLI